MWWRTPEDGVIITKRMSDHEVYVLANEFGRARLTEALEDFIEKLEIKLDKL